MEVVNLREKIIRYRKTKDKKILENLYMDFLVYIRNMSRRIFDYEYKDTDLIIKFIKIIKDLDIEGATDNEVQGKIVKSLERGKIDIIRKSISDKEKKPCYFEDIKLEIRDSKDEYSEVWLKELLEHLKDREKMILKLSFFEDKTDMCISEMLNLSSARVGQIRKNALNKLKEEVVI